jgi:hypothetical protein
MQDLSIVRDRVDDAVAGAQPVASGSDDEEHVFGGAVRQLDRLARRELEAAEAYSDGTRGLREVGAGGQLIPVGEQAGPQRMVRTFLGTQMMRSIRRSPNGGSFETTTHGIPSTSRTSPMVVSRVWRKRTRSLLFVRRRTSSYAGTCRLLPPSRLTAGTGRTTYSAYA